MKFKSLASLILSSLLFTASFSSAAAVEKYTIDTSGAHAFIQFKVNHLGYSWLYGRFNDFEGSFELDPADHTEAKIHLSIDTKSVDTNHAERDKHLRSADFLNVSEHPKAMFKSTSANLNSIGHGTITGDLTLNGVTKPVTLEVTQMGHGTDPWGGYRRGYEAKTTFKMADFGISYDLGPASRMVEMIISIEGIRK